MSPDSDSYTTHAAEYYKRQWELLDDYLSPSNAQLVKRVIREGEEQQNWAKATARNHIRNIRFVIEFGVDRESLSDEPTDWGLDTWNELIADLAIDRDVGKGQKAAYANAVKSFLWFCDDFDDDDRHKIKTPKQERPPIDTENVLSHEEVMLLIEQANNSRDRALIATIYQAALRRGAAVQIDLKHYEDNDEWATVRIPHVEGVKGADGNIKPLTWAKGYIDNWLNNHPEMQKEDPDMDAPLFCSVRKQDDGARIAGHSVYTMLKRLAKQVDEIDDDRIHPHMFKHARGTFMRASPRYDKKDIEQVMDWVESTPMHARYSHADQPSEASRVASKMGVDVEIEDTEPSDCPRCNRQVPPAASYCPHCTLKISDEPPEWWGYFESVARDDDPVVEKYDGVKSAIPELERMGLEQLYHIRETILTGIAALESETQNIDPPEENPDQFKDVKAYSDWDEAMQAHESVVERINDLLPKRYEEDPSEFDLLGQHLFHDSELSEIRGQADETEQ